jgi:hypothetical protein
MYKIYLILVYNFRLKRFTVLWIFNHKHMKIVDL